MIVKCRGGLELVLTMKTCINPPLLDKVKMWGNFLLKMDPQTMNDTIPFCMRMEGTCGEWTGKSRRGGVLRKGIRMLGTNVKFKGLLLKKRFSTIWADMGGGVSLVPLHMIVHRVLAFLRHPTGRAHELTILISLIDQGYDMRSGFQWRCCSSRHPFYFFYEMDGEGGLGAIG